MPIPPVLAFSFIGLTVLLLIATYIGLQRGTASSSQKPSNTPALAVGGLTLWLAVAALLAQKGILADWQAMPPRLLLILVPAFFVPIALCFSPGFGQILDRIPPSWLITIQSYRIVVEIILWRLSLVDVVPIQMTFEGRNWDIVAGVTALIVGPLVGKRVGGKGLAIGWNVLGLALLMNILVVAVLSTPLPIRQFMNEPANTAVAEFPMVWLPAFVAPYAFALHLFSIRQALRRG